MRKIKRGKHTKVEIGEAKKKRFSKQTLWTIVVVVVMAFSVIGFMWTGGFGSSTQSYKDIVFTVEGKFLVTKINNKPVSFYNHPSLVDYINISDSILNKVKNSQVIYTTSNESDKEKFIIGEIEFDMQRILYEHFGAIVEYAFTENNTFGKPVMTCENATVNAPVIYFKTSNTTEINMENNCIIFEAKSDIDFKILRDRLLYGIFGIIGENNEEE